MRRAVEHIYDAPVPVVGSLEDGAPSAAGRICRHDNRKIGLKGDYSLDFPRAKD
jgi:hypothetical protein